MTSMVPRGWWWLCHAMLLTLLGHSVPFSHPSPSPRPSHSHYLMGCGQDRHASGTGIGSVILTIQFAFTSPFIWFRSCCPYLTASFHIHESQCSDSHTDQLHSQLTSVSLGSCLRMMSVHMIKRFTFNAIEVIHVFPNFILFTVVI